MLIASFSVEATNAPFMATPPFLFPGDLWTVVAVAYNANGQERVSPPVSFKVRPANDDFAHSQILTGFEWGSLWIGAPLKDVGGNAETAAAPQFVIILPGRCRVWGTTRFASAERGEPAHGRAASRRHGRYAWTAPGSGVADFRYQLKAPDTVWPSTLATS